MELHSHRDQVILRIAKILSWFTRELLVVWLTGENQRLGWVEYWLPRLVQAERLTQRALGKVRLYTRGRNFNLNLTHELGCSTLLTRFYISDRSAEILTLPYFKKRAALGIVPDGGLVYSPWVLLWEYSTADNCERLNVLRWKVSRYIKVVDQRPNYQVVFVLDVPREKLNEIVTKLTSHPALFYVDYQTFTAVKLGRQLIEPIYLNGSDGQKYPLRQ